MTKANQTGHVHHFSVVVRSHQAPAKTPAVTTLPHSKVCHRCIDASHVAIPYNAIISVSNEPKKTRKPSRLNPFGSRAAFGTRIKSHANSNAMSVAAATR